MARKRISPGQSLADGAISASTWNDLLTLLDYRDSVGLWTPPPKVTEPQHREHKGTQFLCRNSTGATIPAGGIMGIDSLGIDKNNQYGELTREITLTGVPPTIEHLGKFAVALEPIENDRFGPVAIAGGVAVKVNIADKDHKFCEVEDGVSTALKSCTRGSGQILWKQSEEGDGVWCAVRLCNYVPPVFWLAKVTDNMCPSETTQECDELEALDGCANEEVPDEVTARNLMACAVCDNGYVILVRTSGDEDTGWAIIQAKHQAQEVLTSAQYVSCSLQFPKKELAVMHCCPSTSPVVITMYEHSYVAEASLDKVFTESMDPQNSTCELRLRGKTDTFCAFEPVSLSSLTTFTTLALENLEVGLPVTDDGTCLEQATQWIWVLCAADPSSAADILCLDDCAVGS